VTVPDDALIPDDLLRQIIAVGQVDLLVGVATGDHGDGIVDLARAVGATLRTHFPRQRTALLNVDRGSSDGTPDLLRQCWREPGLAAGLRTTHYMSISASVWAEDGATTRCILAAADLLQASGVVVLDADVQGITPAWVAALAAPLRDATVDLVAPAYRRRAHDGLLVTQLLRPLIRTIYQRNLREPLLAEFGCSGRLAAHCTQAAWTASPVQRGTSVWIAGEAMAGRFAIRQVDLGPRRIDPGRPRPGLPDVFRQVVGSTFATVEAHADAWMADRIDGDLPILGEAADDAAPRAAPVLDGSHLLDSFAHDVDALDEVLRRLLSPATVEEIRAASRTTPTAVFPDGLWATTVAEFLVAYHHAVIRRDHITQALLPLYTARTGAFLLEHGDAPPETAEAAIASLHGAFARVRTQVVERWLQPA
jgi:glucosylglycerate synthase